MKQQVKKLPLFWVIFGGAVLLFLILLAIGGAVLHSYLAAFEADQPVHCAQNVFATYFEAEDFAGALALGSCEISPYETPDAAEAALKAMKDGKTMSFYAVSASEKEAKYNVVLIDPADEKAGETGQTGDLTAEMKVHGIPSVKIAALTFRRGEQKGRFGFRGWEFSAMELFPQATCEGSALLPEGYTLLINGVEAKEDLITEQSDHEWNRFLPQGVPGIKLNHYTVSHLMQPPVFTAKGPDGAEVALSAQEETGLFIAPLTFTRDVPQDLKDRILTGMKEYAKYIQADGSVGRVSPYFDTTSEFYRNTALNPAAFVWDHNGYAFENEGIDQFYYFDENTLCCHVFFDQHLKKTGREDYVDSLDMTIFVRKIGSRWCIYDRIVR